MVDARGGAMRGCRHSGVRVIIPPRRAPMPMRITCRYLRKEKLAYPPPLMEGEACASRILEVGPSGAKFLGPVIIEVPHFASLRGREREIVILRSDNGETWREHTLEASDDAVHDVFNESFEGEELTAREHLSTDRITRILTTDFPQYFAIISRVRQEIHVIGPEGGMVSSTVVPQVQVIFPEGALTKKIKVGLQAQPISPELVTKLLGNRVAVSPILTVDPRRRKFHKPITLTIPVPQAATKGMINQYSGDAPTLRLLCSITGCTTKAQWEDVTGSTPLTFVNDCVSFTTTVSARFWLIDCRQVNEATKFATELYREAIHVPFMAKFVVFAKRHDPLEAQLRVFCMTDDKEDKTLESQEHFTEVAKSRDVEVLEGKLQYLEFAGNLVPVTKSGEQLSLPFQAFRENRLPFTIRVKDPHQEPMGRVAFMREPRVGRGEPPQSPICNLNIVLPEADLTPISELVTLERKYGFVKENSLSKPEQIHRADLRVSDIAKELRDDWVLLALQLDLSESDINSIRTDHPNDTTQQALSMLRLWLQRSSSCARGNLLEKGLRKINREDIVNNCMFNVELVTDDVEKAVAKVHLDQSGFDTFKEELGSSRDASLRRDTSLNGAFDEQDIMKDAESANESSSESSDRGDRHGERKKRTTAEPVVRTSTRVLGETPDTLVQSVPSAISDVYSRAMNGQMSDASGHEEDRSEPTVATLSSEATGEVDVSSLDDNRSQGEPHIEKRAHLQYNGPSKYHRSTLASALKISGKESPRTVKHKQKLKNAGGYKRKTICHVLSSSAASKRKKVIDRRNSWPPVSPLKVTCRKRYHETVKVKDFNEPFWLDSYEWLTMKCPPERFKTAPLAKMSEFDDFKLVVSYDDYKRQARCASALLNKERPKSLPSVLSRLSFYFTTGSKQKQVPEKKKYLQVLNKCSVPNLRPTKFGCFSHSTDDIRVKPAFAPDRDVSVVVQNTPVKVERKEFIADVQNHYSPSRFSYYDINVDNIENQGYSYSERHSPSPRSFRPLQSFNYRESRGHVLVCSPVSHVANPMLKQKVIAKESLWDKENVVDADLVKSFHFDQAEKGKRAPQSHFAKKNQKFSRNSDFMKNKQHSQDKLVHSVPFSFLDNIRVTIPKEVPYKGNEPGFVSSPQDMMDNDGPSGKSSGSSSGADKASAHSDSNQGGIEESVRTPGSSYSSQGSKPYLRQLFEEDIHSNYAKSSAVTEEKANSKSSDKDMKSKDNKPKDEKAQKSEKAEAEKKEDIPAVVLGRAFLSTLIEQTKSSSPGASIPATVIGQSFLKTLQEQSSGASVEEKTIPAEVIGQSFLKNLLTAPEPESVETSEKVLPAPVLGQTFLKSLLSSMSSEAEGPSSSSSKDVIPSAVLSQEFLKTLIAEKSSQETQEMPVIPSSVVGQAFLKSLVEQAPAEASKSASPIPAPVITQAFLKSLVGQKPEQKTETKGPIPAPVVGQSFIKSLVEASTSAVDSAPSAIPSAVVGQTFLKTLIKQGSSQSEGGDIIPAPVVSQAFLKSLIRHQAGGGVGDTETESSSESSIPSSVVAQTFLKSLLSEPPETAEGPQPAASGSKEIPASVIGQSFLKSLIEEQVGQSSSENVTPASVLGQVFLKTLVDSESAKSGESTIPAPVVAQSFLKSLSSEELKPQEKVLPSSVVSQTFLKSLLTDSTSEHPVQSDPLIPSSVVSQAFLKSLLDKSPSEGSASKETAIPSSVVGQAFLKSLLDQPPSEEAVSKEPVIPSSVLGQAFLKSLLDQPSSEESASKEAVIPSSVVCQAFLKSLFDQQPSEVGSKETIIPSSVLGQTFLKSLIEAETESSVSPEKQKQSSECPSKPAIPAPVVGQAFLSSLLSQASKPDASDVRKRGIIPASVVGLAFLKTLDDQAQSSLSTSESSDRTSEDKAIPANVVGQAFLKTLCAMTDESAEPSEQSVSASCTDVMQSDHDCHNGFHNGNHSVGGIDDSGSSIIPPPPEFCNEPFCSSSQDSLKPELSSKIIEELLSCTKVMQSVIESMKESDALQTASDSPSTTSDVSKEDS